MIMMTEREQAIYFLKTVLPETGWYSYRYKKHKTGMTVQWTNSIESLYDEMKELSWQNDVYFSTCSFKDCLRPNADNVLALKAFRLDMDNSDIKSSIESVIDFCDKLKLPIPSFVHSGRGLHVWWPLNQETTPGIWLPAARRLKDATKAYGLLCDHTVTSDIARILRCPGTLNHKTNLHKEVVLSGSLKPNSLSRFSGFLTVKINKVKKAPQQETVLNKMTHEYYCQLLAFIPNNPETTYEEWFNVGAAINELGWGDTGKAMFLEWSKQHATHDETKFDTMWNSLGKDRENKITPATLAYLAEKHNPINPLATPFALEDKEPGEEVLIWEMTKELKPKNFSINNTRKAIAELKVECRTDLFDSRQEIKISDFDNKWRAISDSDIPRLIILISTRFRFEPSKAHVEMVLDDMFATNIHDSVLDYLDSLVWDGTPRLDKWLTTYIDAEDNETNSFFGQATLMAAVRRAKRPGCKFDHILILEGKQGAGKSRAVEILAGSKDRFSDQRIINHREQQQQEQMEGIWFYEISELAGMRRADVNALKAFSSRTEDKCRKAYGKYRTDTPRRCVFIGTTNDADPYLEDQTGNRRFWPVSVGKTDQEALRRDRDQLFAEAVIREREHDGYFGIPEHLQVMVEMRQDSRQAQPKLYDTLRNVRGKIENEIEFISTADIKEQYMQLQPRDITGYINQNIAAAMRAHGWESHLMWLGKDKSTLRGWKRDQIDRVCPLNNHTLDSIK